MSSQKSLPLTKEEVMHLVDLIQTNPVLLSKATNAMNNQLKDEAWLKITNTFNTMVASNPRKPEQLRLKWENLKKAARKRSTKIRMNNLKTGGGKPEYIPPDALDKVAEILGLTCDGYTVQFGGDAVETVQSIVVEEVTMDSTSSAGENTDTDHSSVPSPGFSPLLRTPPPKKFFFSSTKSQGKLKKKAVADEMKASIIARNRAIADYYEAKKKQHELITALKKKKLELEIRELEKSYCPDIPEPI